MRRLIDTPVLEDEIDTLGHMNVQFYTLRAQQAHRAYMDLLGLGEAALAAQGLRFSQVDLYTRYHREQFQGAPLFVQGGPIGVGQTGAAMFYETRNEKTGECAASFIAKYELIEVATRAPRALPREFASRLEADKMVAPDYGQPRSLDLGPPRTDVSYEKLSARAGDGEPANVMSRRLEWTVEAEECDEFGWVADDEDISFGNRRRMMFTPEGEAFKPPIYTTDEGHRFGWAQLETRNIRLMQPRLGDRLSSIGAEIAIFPKTHRVRRWVFNLTAGNIASVNDSFAIALDIDARRPIEIPAAVRRELERSHMPEFA